MAPITVNVLAAGECAAISKAQLAPIAGAKLSADPVALVVLGSQEPDIHFCWRLTTRKAIVQLRILCRKETDCCIPWRFCRHALWVVLMDICIRAKHFIIAEHRCTHTDGPIHSTDCLVSHRSRGQTVLVPWEALRDTWTVARARHLGITSPLSMRAIP